MVTYNKIVALTLTIKGDYTDKIDLIKRIENIPENTLIVSKYDPFTNTTVLSCMYEQEVKEYTEY